MKVTKKVASPSPEPIHFGRIMKVQGMNDHLNAAAYYQAIRDVSLQLGNLNQAYWAHAWHTYALKNFFATNGI